jgi:hypothetical protein
MTFSVSYSDHSITRKPLILFTGETTDVSIWSCIEPGLGITAVSLVALRPLFVSLLQGVSTLKYKEKPSGYGFSRPPTPRHPPNYGLRPTSRSKPNTREGYLDKGVDSTIELQGLPPRPPMPKMGHSVYVEGGSSPREKNGPAKLTKSNSSRNASNKSRSSEEKEQRGLDVGITKTYDVRTYSDNDLSEISFYDAETSASSPLDGGKKGRPSRT